MPLTTRFIQRNIERAKYSLPFLHPVVRDLITLIPALLALREPVCGVHGHAHTLKEVKLLKAYVPDFVKAPGKRLPDRIVCECVIAIPRPTFANAYYTAVDLVIIPKEGAPEEEIRSKLEDIRVLLEGKGLRISPFMLRPPLPQLLVSDIIRLGIVLAGKHPIVKWEELCESSIYIGDPQSMQNATMFERGEWNPFLHVLDSEVRSFIERSEYPAISMIPGANPYIIPFLHILNRYEEEMQAEKLKKLRACLCSLFCSFGPTQAIVRDLARVWRLPEQVPLEALSFPEAIHLRSWLVPLEKEELPIVTWPPPRWFIQDKVHLQKSAELWSIAGKPIFKHRYPWVVLAWGAVSGLIDRNTTIHRHSGRLRDDAVACLMYMVAAVSRGADIIVPSDHTQGSIRVLRHRFFYSERPFALLEEGTKHSLDLDGPVMKKSTLDDTGIEKYLKKRGV